MEKERISKLDSLLGGPFLSSEDRKSMIYSLENTNNKVKISGYVQSDSKPGLFHEVSLEYDKNRVISGSCDCESYQYRGFPCKHTLEMDKIKPALNQPIIASYQKKVFINSIVMDPNSFKLEMSGAVLDDAAKKKFNVQIDYIPFHLLYGRCDCGAEGEYCSHMLKLRDVYLANRKKKSELSR